MTSVRSEQRNEYKGNPPRPWVLLRFEAPNGDRRDVPLLADTGSPFSVVLSGAVMANLKWEAAAASNSNFGLLEGGWVHVAMPQFGVDQEVIAYANDAVAKAAKRSDPDFEGIVGLPLLRRFEFGGDADWFWIRFLTSNAPQKSFRT